MQNLLFVSHADHATLHKSKNHTSRINYYTQYNCWLSPDVAEEEIHNSIFSFFSSLQSLLFLNRANHATLFKSKNHTWFSPIIFVKFINDFFLEKTDVIFGISHSLTFLDNVSVIYFWNHVVRVNLHSLKKYHLCGQPCIVMPKFTQSFTRGLTLFDWSVGHTRLPLLPKWCPLCLKLIDPCPFRKYFCRSPKSVL